jgi:N-hydroxyarylamine O-acetyltransferase
MEGKPFPLDEYLDRIGLEGGGAATVDRLEAAQRAQGCTIAFENFDIPLGRGVSLDPDHLVDKLVRSRRGGYCFELNGLFLRAIRAMGFQARALLGRVHLSGEPTARSHQVSLVEIGGSSFIADVGLGGMCPRAPIPLELDQESDHDGVTYRLRDHEFGTLLQVEQGGHWLDLYSFDLCPVIPNDIECANHFTSTHPSSFFTHSRIASLAHPEGRVALFNHECTTTRNGRDEVEQFPDDASYLALLAERFGIVLDAPYEQLAPLGANAG